MSKSNKKNKIAILTIISTWMLLISFSSHSAMLLNGDFEDGLNNWEAFGNISVETMPNTLVNGTQALKMFGNFNANLPFTVASQYIAVDGINFNVGEKILLEGLIGHLAIDPLSGPNTAYIEIAFAFDDVSINSVDFSNAVTSEFLDSTFATDTFFEVSTPSISIPELVFGQATAFIRVAAAVSQPDGASLGAAWFDDIELKKVSSPNVVAVILLACFAVALRKNRL